MIFKVGIRVNFLYFWKLVLCSSIVCFIVCLWIVAPNAAQYLDYVLLFLHSFFEHWFFIDFQWISGRCLHSFFEAISLTYLLRIFWSFRFSHLLVNPRRHEFYCMNIRVSVVSPFSKNLFFYTTTFRKYEKSCLISALFVHVFSSLFQHYCVHWFPSLLGAKWVPKCMQNPCQPMQNPCKSMQIPNKSMCINAKSM